MKKPKLSEIVVVDFETFYSTTYTLSKMNTSEYIRDPQFKAHCVGIKIGEHGTKTYAGEDISRALHAIDWEKYAFAAHNCAFDAFIMKEIFNIVPHFYIDTMSMTRGLHNNVIRAKLEDVARFYGLGGKIAGSLVKTKGIHDLPPELLTELCLYCAKDVDLTAEIMKIQLDVYPEAELQLIDMTIRMFTDNLFKVDIDKATAARDFEIAEKENLMAACGPGITKEVLSSPGQFASLLREQGVKVPMKPSPSNRDQMIFAFARSDPEYNDLLEHENAQVARLTRARIAVKSTINESRAQRLINAGEGGKTLPVGLNYCAANTFRWGGTNSMNLTNLPSRGNTELRNSLIAPEGYKILAGDSKQIEARIIAWIASHQELVDLFANGEGVYEHKASEIYNVPVSEVSETQRFVGKSTVLGAGFGMGALKFQTTLALGIQGPPLDIPFVEAQRVIQAFRRTNKPIVDFWAACDRAIFKMARGDQTGTLARGIVTYEKDTLWMPNGLSMNYPGLHISEDNDKIFYSYGAPRYLWGGTMTENIVQCLARIIIGLQMIEINKEFPVYHMVHDEIINIVKDEHVEGALKNMEDKMRVAPAWMDGLPLDMDYKIAQCFQ